MSVLVSVLVNVDMSVLVSVLVNVALQRESSKQERWRKDEEKRVEREAQAELKRYVGAQTVKAIEPRPKETARLIGSLAWHVACWTCRL